MPLTYGEIDIGQNSLNQLKAGHPSFPIQFLKGKPVFWDDFESGPAGFIMPERALAYQTVATGPRTLSAGRWNIRDGNEYGCYITGDAASSGKRSLFTGGDPTTRTYGDIGNQDVSCDVSVPSGIIGVEFSLLAKVGLNPAGHLLSIEDKDPATSTRFREMRIETNFWGSPYIQIFPAIEGATNLLTGVISDDNGLFGVGLTNPALGAGSSFVRGSTGAWHRLGFVVDMNLGKFIAFWLDKYVFINKLKTFASSNWIIGNPDPTANTLKEGIKRIEFHSVTNGTAFAPEIYHDDIVVTDEGGQTY